MEKIKWTEKLIKSLPTEDYLKYREEIRDFYRNQIPNKKQDVDLLKNIDIQNDQFLTRYERNANRVKHINISNCRPILYWNSTEVFLYLFYRNITPNDGYRYGLTRFGCSICPFASPWSEFIISKLFPDLTKAYTDILGKYSKRHSIFPE